MTKIHGKQIRRLVRPGRTGARPVAEALALAALSTLLALGAAGARPVAAAEVVRSQEVPAPGADEAVAVFIREQRFVGSARTMFVYVDDRLAGVLDNGTWTYAVVPPGEVTLWLNWAKVTHAARLEPGKVHWFNIPMSGFVEVDEATGRALVAAVGDHATPTAKEEKTAQEHIRERYGKAQQAAARAPEAKPATGRGERERHIARWPRVDLAAYPVLIVEEFAMADPKAAERSKEYLVDTAPGRLASQIVQNLPAGLFAEVRRGGAADGGAGAVVLRGRITQYKPGSAAGRAMLAGVGAARLDFETWLVDAATGEELARFADERSWSWGGVVGAAGGIDTIEQNLAYELALYLERCRGAAGAPAEASATTRTAEPAKPAETPEPAVTPEPPEPAETPEPAEPVETPEPAATAEPAANGEGAP